MNIKKILSEKRIKQWEVAEVAGVSEFTLSRWLRKPEKLSTEQLERIQHAINQLCTKEG